MTGNCIAWKDSRFLTALSRAVSWFGDGILIPVILVALVAGFFLIFKKDKLFSLVLIISSLAGEVLKSVLKNLFRVPRPETFGCRTLTTYGDEFSFPSGHTIFYVIFFGLVGYYYLRHLQAGESKIVLGFSSVLILLVGLSRLYLGAHWYPDVIAGYLLGAIILTTAILLYNRLSKKKVAK